jgi:asparagine synthase (glutamine-hydrolysing)
MCGIAGFWDRQAGSADELRSRVATMSDTLRHRGPDDAGTFVDDTAGVALGTRRLAILDLSALGHQPMASADGRYVVSFNGEIYNHLELRAQLEQLGVAFRGTSDTEVLVAAFGQWGITDTLIRSNGMFALAVWDRHERELHLARDRFGEKPVYYGWAQRTLVFGSELKALRAHPCFEAAVDRDVLALYLRHNCVPAPYSIYRGVAKLMPGTVVTFARSTGAGTLPTPVPYWSLAAMAETARRTPGDRPDDAAIDELDDVMRRAVSLRTRADVGLGAFLSGGIDSSLVVALMQAQATTKVKTFTIAFEDAGYDEAADARAVAAHLGTEHCELLVTARDALDLVPELPTVYDEPFADSSQIPTAVLARLTRRHVTVAMSGDGGDEFFGGYNRYVWAERYWRRLAPVPRPVRRMAGAALGALSPGRWDRIAETLDPVLPPSMRVRMPGIKIHKAARVLGSADLRETYRLLASHAERPERLVRGAVEAPSILSDPDAWPALADPVEQMMYLDAVTYLPDDILTKLDRATMAASLEGLLPFLDPAVAALSWRLPVGQKVHGTTGKWLLRRLLHRYVPATLVERPKAGFGVPLGDWLRGPLRAWAEELLGARRIEEEGYLVAEPVRALWSEHLSGRRDRSYELWDVLMFQAWLAHWRG